MSQIGFPYADAPDPDAIVQCIRCGMCLPHCPTYAVLGIEQDSPRGRIALIKAVNDGRLALTDPDFSTHLYQCLGCRACETACPAGVRFGYLLETSRNQIERARAENLARVEQPDHSEAGAGGATSTDEETHRPDAPAGGRQSLPERAIRWAVFDQLFPHPARLTAAGVALRLYQQTGVQALVRRSGLLKLMRLEKQEALLPPLSRRFHHAHGQMHSPISQSPISNLQSPVSKRVALFAGCVQRLFFADINRATEAVLRRNGCTVITPPAQTCCGALHAHSGDLDGARELARRNLDAFDVASVDAVIINAAGCGAMLKEYTELLHHDRVYGERARAFTAKVRDIHEFLAEAPLDPPRCAPLAQRVTYQDACHLLHGQKIKAAPREVLKSIPGLELVEMVQSDWCCGSAGIYNVTQPQLSQQILKGKMDNVAQTGAEVIAVGNTGCLLQLKAGVEQRGLAMRVAHPVELLAEAYARES